MGPWTNSSRSRPWSRCSSSEHCRKKRDARQALDACRASRPSSFPPLRLRQDVLVEPEEVCRVVGPLDAREPGVGDGRVRLADAIRAFPFQEVDVDAGAFGANLLPERGGPALVDRRILGGIQPESDDRDEVGLL